MKTKLLFGIHCHQPIDNFDKVIFEAIEKSYKPFFKVLENYPSFKISVHFSGWLLEFIKNRDKELFTLMQKLSSQIEFFTGGYYEPILASIPSKDRVGQIKKLNNFIQKYFNQTPKGLWLTERVWDNSIISDLKKCGIEYVIVDDYHFIANGYKKEELKGYFVTEEGGEEISLFPISQDLRYAIPFFENREVNKIIKNFNGESGKNGAIIFDDGEKFGIWPKTYERVYREEWLKEFFETTINDRDIEINTFNEFYQKEKPISLAYLPTLSYAEMGEWSLKAEDRTLLEKLKYQIGEGSRFLKGGIWKNFLTKYQESNWINKRTIELSKKELRKKAYREALYKSQCNDTLWHGIFGGIYLPNLRDNAYRYIIECENLLYNKPNCEEIDIDFDFYNEYKLSSEELLLILSLKNGGQIVEFDLKKSLFNLQNTITRYREAYHSKIEKRFKKESSDEVQTIHNSTLTTEEEIELYYDWYLKKSLIDHISNSINLENFENCSFKEVGDFANQTFEFLLKGDNFIEFKREGGIYLDKKYNTKIDKRVFLENEKIEFEISLKTEYQKKLSYINEWNLHFANIENIKINNSITPIKAFSLKSNKLTIEDNYLNRTFEFNFDKEIEIFIYPLKTVSQSEKGVDYTTQGISFGFIFQFEREFNFNFKFEIR